MLQQMIWFDMMLFFSYLLITIWQNYFGNSSYPLIFAVRFWKKSQFLTENSLRFNHLFSKKVKKDLGDKIKALTFALPIKNGGQKHGQKIFESLETAANNLMIIKVMLAQILIRIWR